MFHARFRHRSMVASFLGLTLLACCCADLWATEPAASSLAVSPACTVGAVLEWGGSPGAPTRAGAVGQLIDFRQGELGTLLLHGGLLERVATLDDAARIRIDLRVLRALEFEADETEQSIGTTDALEVSLEGRSGNVVAMAFITAQGSGGYRLDQYYGIGRSADHPRCRNSLPP